MKIYSNSELTGDLVSLKTTNKKHIGSAQPTLNTEVPGTFKDVFNKALNQVNDLDNQSTNLAGQMASDPGSVNIHDVQIATEKAEMAVFFTKSVVDKVINAYKKMTEL